MMRRIIVGSMVVLVGLVMSPVFAGEVAVSDLVAEGESYADMEVTVVGELIGDYGNRRNGFMWTQLNGDSYTSAPLADGGPLAGSNIGIGIRMPTGLADGLDPPGRYRTVGPIVRVTGMWKYHDPVRQGETYLDVASMEIVQRGRTLHESPTWGSYGLGFFFLGIAAFAWWQYTRRRDAVA